MSEKVFIVLISSEVEYDGLTTSVVAVKRTRKAAEKVVAQEKARINTIWKDKNLEVDTDVEGCYSVNDDNGNSCEISITEIAVTD